MRTLAERVAGGRWTAFQLPLVRIGGGWRTRLIVVGDQSLDAIFRATVFDEQGARVASTTMPLPAGDYRSLELDELVGEKGNDGLMGTAVVDFRDYESGTAYIEVIAPDGQRASTHGLCGGSFRAPVVETLMRLAGRARTPKGRCLYLPFQFNESTDECLIFLHNHGRSTGGRGARAVLRLTTESGRSVTRTFDIPPDATRVLPVRGSFDPDRSLLENQAALISVVCDDASLHGMYLWLGRTVICDHLDWR